MTKIIANNQHKQIIFNSYTELKQAFETTDKAIREAEINGWALRDNTTGEKYWVDKLFSEEDLKK